MEKEIFKVGDRVFDIIRQEWGVVTSIDGSRTYPIGVSFGNEELEYGYTADGFFCGIEKQPRLSFTECSVFDGKFSQERPLPPIEKDTLIYVRDYGLWYMRYFSHFKGEKAVCYDDQMKSKEASSTSTWEEYSLTNPLIEE